MNTKYIEEKIKQRKHKIDTYAATNKVPEFVAAIYIDQHAPTTTNRKMLAEAGFVVDKVTEDNLDEVVDALGMINVNVIINTEDIFTIVNALNNAIDEPVTECWGGPDMAEYIDIGPSNTFQSN